MDNHPNEVLLGSGSAEPAKTKSVETEAAKAQPVKAAAPVKVQEPAPDSAPSVGGKAEVKKAAEPAAVQPKALAEAPARQGRGSSVEAWAAWAAQAGVAVPDGATRNDIIAACVRAGVLPPEEK